MDTFNEIPDELFVELLNQFYQKKSPKKMKKKKSTELKIRRKRLFCIFISLFLSQLSFSNAIITLTVTPDMLMRLVVLFCFHSIKAFSLLNETVSLCCEWNAQKVSCNNFTDSKEFEAFKNVYLFDIDAKLGKPCDMKQLEDDEWFFEVSESASKRSI